MIEFDLRTLQLDDGFNRITVVAKASEYEDSNPSNSVYYAVGDTASYRYVSLGDSIAVGHSINADWEKDYGYQTQYGENGNEKTTIVPGCYTDLIDNALKTQYGKNNVSTVSFAHSGDMVADLMNKLNDQVIINALERASIVTVCIGANDVLQPAMSELGNYITYGTPALDTISQLVQERLDILNNDSNANSYTALLNKLYSINPNAKYLFTTVYNPFKYFWIDESSEIKDYKDGFFGPLMWAIPDTIGNLSNAIRGSLYNTYVVQSVFDRINGPSRNGTDGLAAWTETYITKLNKILSNKINAFGNSNFILADSKALYDTFPDRNIGSNNFIHYNDLVNVEFTRGFVVEDMDWGQFWANFSISDLIDTPENVMSKVMANIVFNVIVPDIDPHPEDDGHQMLYYSFIDAFYNKEVLERYTISYEANGGSGTMQSQLLVGISTQPAYANINQLDFIADSSIVGNHFTSWNTQANGGGSSYNANGLIAVSSNITLYAQWSNKYKLTYMHTNHTNGLYGNNETGHMECYALFINGVEQPDFGTFANSPPRTIEVAYGSTIKVVVSNYNPTELLYDDCDCDIYFNGGNVASGYRGASYLFTLTSAVTIDFRWKIAGSLATFDARSWEDCYITTN